ncbi:MAG: hypothetical protein RBS09_00105 [Anaerolineaceae bacterium]|jgi:hypothetical protein|nr:hypothetical protein [Anaerolineaceae bacterium]
MMTNESMKILWIVLWIIVSAGWSVLSFQWLKKNVEAIDPQTASEKGVLGAFLVRRSFVLFTIAVLFYLALKTEPVAVIPMVITITITTWSQVILYNKSLNKNTGTKEP